VSVFADFAEIEDTTTYPHLGFNPVPGVPDDVSGMGSALSQAVDSMQESGALLDQMRDANSGVWQGDAGDAFREHFNTKLATDLTDAHTSLGTAVDVLKNWHGNLVGFKDTAGKLDQEAADAKQAVARADDSLKNAQNNPDLKLIGQFFNTQQDLQAAQSRIDAAESAVRDAGNAAEQAHGQLDAIMKRAKELAAQHEAAAKKYAQELEHATKGLAPHKPGFFSSLWNDFTKGLSAIGNWVQQHAKLLHTILSTISAVAGLIALVTPPPIDAIAAGVAAVASIGALAMDFANPQFRGAMGQLFTGHFNKQTLGALATGGLDLLGAVPGVGLLAKGGKAAFAGAKAVEEGAQVVGEGAQVLDEGAQAVGGGLKGALDAAKEVGSEGAKNAGFIVNQAMKIPKVAEGLGSLAKTGVVQTIAKGADVEEATAQYAGALLWKGRAAVTDVVKDGISIFTGGNSQSQPAGAAG
jgi:hypothetical protein